MITAVPDTRKKRIVVLYNLIKCIFIVLLETRCGYGTGELVVIVISIRILPAARHCDGRNIARTLDVSVCGRRAVRILYGREIAVIVVGVHIVERFAEELRAVEPRSGKIRTLIKFD